MDTPGIDRAILCRNLDYSIVNPGPSRCNRDALPLRYTPTSMVYKKCQKKATRNINAMVEVGGERNKRGGGEPQRLLPRLMRRLVRPPYALQVAAALPGCHQLAALDG